MEPSNKGEFKKAGQDKLEPTDIQKGEDTQNKYWENPKLTHAELEERLDLYSRIGGDQKQYFKMQNAKKEYRQELQKRNDNNTKASIYYGEGIRAGLQHQPYENIKNANDRFEQEFRNQIAKETKADYHVNNSLSQSFKGENSPSKDIDHER